MVLCGVVGGKRECPRRARENECVVSTATHRQRQWLQSAHTLRREVGLPPSFCWGFLPHHHGRGCPFLNRSAAAQHAQPILEMAIFTSLNTLADLVGFSLLSPWMWLKPQPPCPGFGTMPCQWVQDWYSHWSMSLPLHFILFPCPSCVYVTQCTNSVPLSKPLGSGGHQ